MSNNHSFRGPDGNAGVELKSILRDTRSTGQKFADFMSNPDSFMMVIGMCIAMFFIAPYIGELIGIITFFLIRYSANKTKNFKLPFRMPKTSGMIDHGQINPGTDRPELAEGISYFGNERNTKKELWFNNSDLRTHILIFGSTGAGKALKMDELIHTPNGWKKNRDLNIGDFVSTPFGRSKIVGIYPQGKLELFEIIFEDGRSIEVSGDHLWEIHNENYEYIELGEGFSEKAKVLKTEDIMLEMHNKKSEDFFIILSNEIEKPYKDLEISPYMLGLLLENVNIINKNIIFISQNEIIFNKISKYLSENDLFNQLEKLNLINFYSNNKHIPTKYKESTIEQRYELIQGLMDSNGYVENGVIKYKSQSTIIANGIIEIINSLGGIVYKENTNEQEIILSIYLKNNNKLFSIDNIFQKDILKNNINKLKIANIIKTDKKEECQCIKIRDSRGLFITKDYIVTHNTESLLSLAYNALVQGSGLIYVDGKGENVLFTKVFSMARTMGREDDVLCINYMTGSRDVFGAQEKKLSNTLNPFSSGGSGGLTELVVSLMDDGGGGGDMWKGRAISLISAIMMALVYMRDQKEILLDVEAIREHLILDTIIKMYKTRKDFPVHIRAALRAYLLSIPGFQESAPKQNDTVMEQHGYLQMQFTKLLGSLSDQYGFIFKTNLGEVDFKDVVLNRRILVVLLPALEKSTDELANLGKIIVACLKQMMAQALGATVEGSYAEVVETKPTNSPVPFMTVLDEYGYYAVKGSAVMPAQARSLGFSMIFAGQDLPAFEKASKEEAASIVANCNIKICMKLEDPKDTYQLFEAAAAETTVVVDNDYKRIENSFFGGMRQDGNGRVETKKRINILDLKDQKEGEAHIIFKSALVRAKMFYAFTPKPPYIRMNYFVRVEPPDIEVINQLDNSMKALLKNISNENKIKELEEQLELDNEHIINMREILNKHSNLKMIEAAFATIACLGNKIYETYEDKIDLMNNGLANMEELEEPTEINIFSNKKETEKYMKERYAALEEDENKTRYDEDDDYEDDDFSLNEDEDEDINVFIEEEETKKVFEDIEKMVGSAEEEAKDNAERSVEDMKKVSKYPSEVRPEAKEPEEIMDILNELDEMFDSTDEN